MKIFSCTIDFKSMLIYFLITVFSKPAVVFCYAFKTSDIVVARLSSETGAGNKKIGAFNLDSVADIQSNQLPGLHVHSKDVQFSVNSTVLLQCHLQLTDSRSIVWMHSASVPLSVNNSSSSISNALARFPSSLCHQIHQHTVPNSYSALLAIRLVSPASQSGYYWCQSAKSLPSQSPLGGIFHLRLQGSPVEPITSARVKQSKRRLVISVSGSKVTLSCPTSPNLSENQRLTWMRNGKQIDNWASTAAQHSKVLVINSAAPTDSGLYTCWRMDGVVNSQLAVAAAQWELLVLELDAFAYSSRYAGRLDCIETLDFGSSSAKVRPCLAEWSAAVTADELSRLASATRRDGSTGDSQRYGYEDDRNQLLRRRRNVHSDGSSAWPVQLANLRVASLTNRTVRIAWDRPASPGCYMIELQLHQASASSSVSDSAATASCVAEFANLFIRPGVAYRLSALIVDSKGRASQPAVLNFSTTGGGPGGHRSSPSGLSAWSRGGVVHVAWQPPSGVADIVDYTVAYRPQLIENEAMTDGERQLTVVGVECVLRHLPSRHRFAVRVAARSAANGVGPFTAWLPFDTGAAHWDAAVQVHPDESPTDAMADKLRIKESDIVVLKKRDSILLSWTRPSNILPEKYVISYGDQQPKEHKAGEIPGDQDSFHIRDLRPDQRYFIAIMAVKQDFQFVSTIVAYTLGSKDDPLYSRQPPQVPMAVKVTQVASRSVVVSWADPQLGLPGVEPERRIYEVEWSFDAADQPQLGLTLAQSLWHRNTSELSVRLSQLRPSTAYSVRVRCHAELAPAPSEFSMRAVFATLAEAPGSPPRDLKVSRSALSMSSMSAVMLSWLPPLEPNGKVSKYTVLYRSHDPVRGSGQEHSTTTAETQVVITGLKPATLYYFRVRAENSEGFGPDCNVTMFMMPDSSGQGGGMVYNTDSVLQRDSADGADSDGLSSRRWWLLIGGVFGLALLLLAISTGVVCACQQRRPRHSERARAAKESASLIGGLEQQQSLQPPPGPPGKMVSAPALSPPPTSTAILAPHQLQHQLQHQQLQLQHQQQQQQRTPDLCRHADFELRAMDFNVGRVGVSGAGNSGGVHPMMLMQPPPPLLLESGPVPNQPLTGHFRNLSNSGGGGGYQQQHQLPIQAGGQRIGSVVSPPRVDAPDFSSPGKLSSPHSSLSSSIGSASKQRHAVATAGVSLMSTSAHSRPYPAPDILNPASGHRQLPLHDQQQQQQHPNQLQLRNSHATIGSLTLESQNSRSFALSSEDIDMTKTLDGLIQDLKGLATREFEC